MALSQSVLAAPAPFFTEGPVANAATNSNPFSVPATIAQRVQVMIQFTLGSLTNAIATPQISVDGTTWFNATTPGALTMTATGNYAFTVDCAGAKLFRVQVTSSGTTTSSTITINLGFQKFMVTN